MYKLRDQHIDFILNDISARGVTIEDLQYNLLDHICCIIENNLEENGDFENFYLKTVRTFFKKDLKEIEDETISLVIFKHYYTMKKIMLVSGTLSAFFFTFGIVFKFMHWPGASLGIVLGIGILSLIFLPLMFVLKIREKQDLKDKLVIGIGTLAGVLISLGTLFKVQHWPYANIMSLSSLLIMIFLFLPLYFFSGIRKPETKVNTIVSSILLLSACGLLLTLIRSPRSSLAREKLMTEDYLRGQEIFKTANAQLEKAKMDSLQPEWKNIGKNIISICEEMKLDLIESETGTRDLAKEFASGTVVIGDHQVQDNFEQTQMATKALALQAEIKKYNAAVKEGKLYESGMFYDGLPGKRNLQAFSNFDALDQLTRLQMLVINNQRSLIACK